MKNNFLYSNNIQVAPVHLNIFQIPHELHNDSSWLGDNQTMVHPVTITKSQKDSNILNTSHLHLWSRAQKIKCLNCQLLMFSTAWTANCVPPLYYYYILSRYLHDISFWSTAKPTSSVCPINGREFFAFILPKQKCYYYTTIQHTYFLDILRL